MKEMVILWNITISNSGFLFLYCLKNPVMVKLNFQMLLLQFFFLSILWIESKKKIICIIIIIITFFCNIVSLYCYFWSI